MKDLNILVVGQVLTSRTETVEAYLKDKVKSLGVIGISSPYLASKFAHTRCYDKGRLLWQKSIKNIHCMRKSLFTLTFIFSVYFISILKAVRGFRKKFDIYIGISCFSACVGVLLKRLKITKYLIYYSIDYYPLPKKFNVDTIAIRLFRLMDRFCVLNSDVVWSITSRITEERVRASGVSKESYQVINVPLCFDDNLLRFKPIEQVQPHILGFVGIISPTQGLQLVVEALPDLVREIPDIKVRIIGSGPYLDELKEMLHKKSLTKHVIFHGFIKEEGEVMDILSTTAIGIAPWTTSQADYSKYADPGKPKLYAFCGLPTILTNSPEIAQKIHLRKAGISINYNRKEFVNAVLTILKSTDSLEEYRRNARLFAEECTSSRVFSNAWKETKEFLSIN